MRYQIYFRTSMGFVVESKLRFDTQKEADTFMRSISPNYGLDIWSEEKPGPATARFCGKSLQLLYHTRSLNDTRTEMVA